jgi:hypothetical protein
VALLVPVFVVTVVVVGALQWVAMRPPSKRE